MIREVRRRGTISGLLAVLMTAGCATVVNGFSQDLAVDSEPAGARVTLSNGQSCTTPCALSVPRNQPLVATIVKPGCNPVRQVLYSVPRPGDAGWFSSTVLYGAIDYELGGAYQVSPNPLAVRLFCGGEPAAG